MAGKIQECRNFVLVESSWRGETLEDVSQCVMCRLEETEDELTDLTLLPPEAVCLSRPDDSSRCSIQFQVTRDDLELTAIDVLCTARRMELSGQKDEYLGTIEGMYIEPADTTGQEKLYLLQHTLEAPCRQCSIRIVSMVEKHRVLIHSIHLTLARARVSMQHPLLDVAPTIDVGKVKAIMKDMNKEIPANAQGILASMENTQRNKETMMGLLSGLMGSGGGAPSPAMAAMMQMMGQVPPSGFQQHQQPSGGSSGTKSPQVAVPGVMSSCDEHSHNSHIKTDNCKGTPGDMGILMEKFAVFNVKQDAKSLPAQTNDTLPNRNVVEGSAAKVSTAPEVQHISHDTEENEHSSGRSSQSRTHSSSTMDNPLNIPLLLPLLESRFTALLKESEQRICQHLTEQINQSEVRIMQKLESMMNPKGST